MNSVNLTKRVNTSAGLRYCPVVETGNGRIKPDYVLVDGSAERHPEGSYYLDWTEAGKRRRSSVGTDPTEALTQKRRQEHLLALGLSEGAKNSSGSSTGSVTLAEAIKTYLKDVSVLRKPATHDGYASDLRIFGDFCSKKTLKDLERSDLIGFIAHLKEEDYNPSTIKKIFTSVTIFLKTFDIKLHRKGDTPRDTLDEPEAYTDEELAQLYSVCSPEEQLLFDFHLMTGMRAAEVENAHWAQVNFKDKVIRVVNRADFTTKNMTGREIPVPDTLLDRLQKKPRKGECIFYRLEFALERPLDLLKKRAAQAGLNPDDFWLHKFRSTFATTALRAGVDLVTVKAWMGHKDMKSTMRYLQPNRTSAVQEKVNMMFARG
jgi:integrase